MTVRELDVPPRSRRGIETLSLLTNKWHPAVVVTLQHHGPLGFNELRERIPGVSGKVLSETLERLRDVELIERRVVNESPLRVEYDLTDAGRDMEPVFEALGEWGQRHLASETPTVLLADADRRLTRMYGQWLRDRYAVVRAHSGEQLLERFDEDVDVVVLDDGLIGIDPREFVEGPGQACRTILLVGDRRGPDAPDVDCDDVLRKPLVQETVVEAIADQLSR